jgi:hypothetical protein
MTSKCSIALGAIAVLASVSVGPASGCTMSSDARGVVGAEDCAGSGRVITVKFLIGRDGYLQGPIDTGGLAIDSDIEARRAVAAVRRAQPYAATYRGLIFVVRFKDGKTCAERN